MAERHPDLGVRVTVPDPVLPDHFEALGEISGLCARLAARRAFWSDMIAVEELVGRMHKVSHLRAIAREVLFAAGICPTNPV